MNKTNMYIYHSIFLVFAIFQLSSAADCDINQCGLYSFRIQCNSGYRPVFATCSCCLTCEEVLSQGETCEVRAPQNEYVSGGVVYENVSYPHCGQGLFCNSTTKKCQRRVG